MTTLSLEGPPRASASTAAREGAAAPLLVCAAGPDDLHPRVVLADGVYETETERVFWNGEDRAEVLRLPLEAQVSIRQTGRFPRQRQVEPANGEAALLEAVRAARSAPAPRVHTNDRPLGEVDRHPVELDDGELGQALRTADLELAFASAVQLWRGPGLEDVYRQMSRCLAQLASSWADGSGSVLAEHRATRTVAQVTERLTALSPRPTKCGTVLLAVPDGDQHTAALGVLSHLLRDAGHATQVVDALPTGELLDLARAPGTSAVVLSIHTTVPTARLRSVLRSLRAAAPEVLLAVGGPALPAGLTTNAVGADVVGEDLGALLRALDGAASGLTEREAQVLRCVSDGLTNNEIARHLGVAPATVKSHLDNILSKTGTEHRAAAVARALRRGWIA